ncbi:hypothetical protein [Marinitoga litoralis]|jgi:hypothetical protein|uniref:hypothetical protein n=1 Tax=Marinitoga litoralis TaxID=570855 RepID=UPI00195FDA3A|nr:hypothetical protein [Marinitoga litoralis]MBM7560415.1 hypothetical protein [Marinitoga litoralis]
MATSSFNRNFTLKSKREVESFIKIIQTPSKPIKIDKKLVSPEREKEGVEKLRKILSR